VIRNIEAIRSAVPLFLRTSQPEREKRNWRIQY
jgi:hypothetical protein